MFERACSHGIRNDNTLLTGMLARSLRYLPKRRLSLKTADIDNSENSVSYYGFLAKEDHESMCPYELSLKMAVLALYNGSYTAVLCHADGIVPFFLL